MNKLIQNFWSFNSHEVYVASWLKDNLGPEYEVFFPVNSRFPYVDLIVFNSKNKKTVTVQVKSSQSYSAKYENKKYWVSGHKIPSNKINPDKVDFFIFTYYYPELTKKKTVISRNITNYFIVFQTSKLLDYVNKFKDSKTVKSKRIPFNFYIYPEDGKLYEDGRLKIQYAKSDKPLPTLQNTLGNSNIIKKMLQ